MKPETFKLKLKAIGNSTILTTNRVYVLESSILLLIAIFLVNWISPKSNALYFLLIFPALAVLGIFIFFTLHTLKRPELGIPIIAILLPFERIGALNTSSFNIRLSQVFTIITLVAYIIFIGLTNKKDKIGGIPIKKDFSFFLLTIFALVNIISIAIAPNKARSVYVVLFDLFTFFIYIFLSNLLVSKDILKKTVYALLGISLILCLFGGFQFIAGMLNLPNAISGLTESYSKAVFGFPRVLATETEPQFWGNFLLIPISLSFAILLSSLSKRIHAHEDRLPYKLILLSLIVFILGLINILMTFSRGAWYASVIGLAIIVAFFIRSFISIKTLIASSILIIVIIGGFLFILAYSHAPLTSAIFTSRATAIDDQDRQLTTNAALALFNNHKILGVGSGSFGPEEASNIYQKPQAYGEDIGWRIVNNEYIEILAETGIVGIVSFLSFLLFMIWNIATALRAKTDTYTRTILIGLSAAFVAMLVQYIGFSTLYIMQIWFLFALVNAVAFNINHKIWTYNE